MFTLQNQPLSTLAELNEYLRTNGSDVDVTAADLIQTGPPSAEEIDWAIATATTQVVFYEGCIADIAADINAVLGPVVADPAGYELWTDTGVSAWVNDGAGAANDDAAWKLLISAAHGLGDSRHNSSNARGAPANASAYVHSYGTNALFAFSDDGYHRGIPMVTTLAQGKVNAGTHVF